MSLSGRSNTNCVAATNWQQVSSKTAPQLRESVSGWNSVFELPHWFVQLLLLSSLTAQQHDKSVCVSYSSGT